MKQYLDKAKEFGTELYEVFKKLERGEQRILVTIGGLGVAFLLVVAFWPSNTEVVKAVVKHEVTENEAYQELATNLTELHEELGLETVKKDLKQTFPERIEALTEKAVEVIDKVKRAGMDEELAFYDDLISKSQRRSMAKYSRTKEADAHAYAHLYSMTDPDDATPNDIEVFWRKSVDYVMNDPDTPDVVTEWEARWVSEVYYAKKGYVARESLQGRKDKLKDMFKR